MDSATLRRLSLGCLRPEATVGQLKKFIAQVLAFDGFKVVEIYWETPDGVRFNPIGPLSASASAVIIVRMARVWCGRCSECAERCGKTHEHTPIRRWRDLPWAGRPVKIEYAPDRLFCEACQAACVELLPWADRYQRETQRFQQHLALQAQSMPSSHVAAQYGVDWHCVRRAEKHALERWLATREPVPVTMVGIDEKYLGRRNLRQRKFITIVSNLGTGEPIWIGEGRSEETLNRWLNSLAPDDKATIKLFAVDMFTAFSSAINSHADLRHAAIVHDPFHVMRRALEALDELRRQTFFRAGPELRGIGRGTRWLFLRAWERSTEQQKSQLRTLLGHNRRLAHGYQVVEELRDVLHAPDGLTMATGLVHVMKRTERRDNRPMRKLHDSLDRHFDQIVALGEHHPPTGRIEALNNNWETAVRQGRGYRDLDFLMLKVRFMVANPIRNDDGVRRFLALGLPTPYRAAAA